MATPIILPTTNTLTMNTNHLNPFGFPHPWHFSLFVNPWNVHFHAKLHQHQDTQIFKYAETFHKECSTAAIAMDIESTTAASGTILDLLDKNSWKKVKLFKLNLIH